MKVKQKTCSRCSINELGTPLQKTKKKSTGTASANIPSPALKRFSSMYVSPLGNVAGPKMETDKSKQKQEDWDTSLASPVPQGSGRRRFRNRKRRTVKKILDELLGAPPAAEVIVIPDTPTQPSGSVKTASGGLVAVTPGKKVLRRSARQRKKMKALGGDRPNDASVIIADETPRAVKSNKCSVREELKLELAELELDKMGMEAENPIVIEEIPAAATLTSKRKQAPSVGDVVEISPPRKRRRVTLDSVTIDLDAEAPSPVMLSDKEDDDDVIVLGSPEVASVRGYKAVGRRAKGAVRRPTPGIIARAVAGMGRTGLLATPLNFPATSHANVSGGNKPVKKGLRSVIIDPSTVPPSPVNVYGGNMYNAGSKPVMKGLRPVIIDASNVAMGHGNGKVFSCRGIEICVNYFLKRKHKVFAFLPQFRRHNMYTKDAYLLDKLKADNHLIFTPSRFVDGQSDVPYDDRYIVQTAAELGGVIVSTDNYRDLLRENPHWHDTIKNRLLMFTWVEDLLIFPQDPLGRRGCRLEEFLRF